MSPRSINKDVKTHTELSTQNGTFLIILKVEQLAVFKTIELLVGIVSLFFKVMIDSNLLVSIEDMHVSVVMVVEFLRGAGKNY